MNPTDAAPETQPIEEASSTNTPLASQESPSPETSPLPRAPRRTSRTSMVLAAIMLIVLGSVVWIDLPYYLNMRAFDALRSLGGKIYLRTDTSWNARWNRSVHSDIHLMLQRGQVSDAEMGYVCNISEVLEMHLGGQSITDAGLKRLTWMNSPRSLGTLGVTDAGVTDRGLAYLTTFSNLGNLDLSGCPIHGDGLASLAQLKGLKRLVLSDTPISDDALTHLQRFPELKSLGLDGTKISDSGIAQIAQLKDLKELSLNRTPITDEAISQMQAMTSLKELNLCRTAITDAGLQMLQAFPNLQVVSFDETAVSPDAIDKLKLWRPSLEIQQPKMSRH